MTISDCIMVLNRDPRSESSQLKIFVGTYSNLREKSYPYGSKPEVVYASWKSPLKGDMKAE